MTIAGEPITVRQLIADVLLALVLLAALFVMYLLVVAVAGR